MTQTKREFSNVSRTERLLHWRDLINSFYYETKDTMFHLGGG